MQKIVELRNVTAYRDDHCVFRNLTLEIAPRENTAILGPNGAGKTTLLKLLTRDIYPVDEPDSHLRLFGKERWNVWELRRHLGIVSHDLQREYVGHATGMNVVLSGYFSSMDVWAHHRLSAAEKDHGMHVMETLGITALKEKLYATMSTGEQRRFLLARALVSDPDTLVLDEPTSGLDLKACFQYLDLVRTLMRSGKTILLVTHHIHEIPPEIHRVVLLKQGRVVADGEKSTVLTDAKLSALFDTPIELVKANGFYQAMPGTAGSGT